MSSIPTPKPTTTPKTPAPQAQAKAPAKPLTPKVPAKPTTPKEAKPKAEGKAYVRCESPSKDEKYAVYVPRKVFAKHGAPLCPITKQLMVKAS